MTKRLSGVQPLALEARVGAASSLVVYLDLDLTLAPVFAESEPPGVLPDLRSILDQLSLLEGALVCVLGRSGLAEMKKRLDLPRVVYAGDHGLEIEGESFRFLHPEAGFGRSALQQLNDRLAGLPLLFSGVEVDAKSLQTVIRHRSDDSPDDRNQIDMIIGSLVPPTHPDLTVVAGPTSIAIRPRLDWNKASAIRWIHERIKAPNALAIVIGDRLSEESTFSSLADAVTVRVGQLRGSRVGMSLETQADLLGFLTHLFELWKGRVDSADPAAPSPCVRPALAFGRSSPILNVRLRRAAVGRRRQALR
ncbi:MAG TPA: trehalose-phosphatase [Isosphaeraceae bacterium]|nr:trehalose-phosphatase [Isosphaeraceae bacterium]